jgi:protein tyrosine phosphatase
MVWEPECAIIVMLTRLKEGPKKKCEQYFPDLKGTTTYGDTAVTMESSESTADGGLVVSELVLVRDGETKRATHFWYTAWPDHGVPVDEDGQVRAPVSPCPRARV